MKDDVLKSVSQTGSGKEDAENHRLVKITDELRRRCQLYEKELRTGQSHVTRMHRGSPPVYSPYSINQRSLAGAMIFYLIFWKLRFYSLLLQEENK